VKIGANAVVVRDIPDDATAVGIPAHVVRVKGQEVRADTE
jgi:serine O-acetyltransferase